MEGSIFWVIVECACKILGISTPAVMCAVGVQTLHLADFHSLAVYLLVSSAVMMLFEVAHFTDHILTTWLPYPPTCKCFIIWKKMAMIGNFQKFLYYTMMSVMCFLHPVLVWHAVIPGTLLLVTGFLNFILSKRGKTSSPKQASESYGNPELTAIYITDSRETERTFTFFHIISGKTASLVPDNRLDSPFGSCQAIIVPDYSDQPAHKPVRKTDQGNVHFVERFGEDDTGMNEYYIEPEETTSEKGPMLKL